ncbi:MAG: tetratricopeptide repeat protein [Opitutales bacterium]
MDLPPKSPATGHRLLLLAGWVVLVAAVLAVYHGLGRHRFVNFDDPMYIYENGHVTAGLTAGDLHWAWTNKEALQWEPFTWMAHQSVCTLAGRQPAPHLLVNLALHALNAGLLFTVLWRLTGATGRSFAVALLFAVHPVNVETAAWASQLKSTLSMLFFLLALLAYTRTARRGGGSNRLALLALLASLLAKPMMFFFPLLLALLDFWPLGLLPPIHGPAVRTAWNRWLNGKLPFFLLVGVLGVTAVLPWGSHPEMAAVHGFGWSRLAALPCRYAGYLGLLFWPANLAVLYPDQLDYPLLATAGSFVLLAGITVLAWRWRHRQPALLVGWGWYLLTMLPMSGVLRFGLQGMADRYLYVPAIGIFLAVVWLVADAMAGRWRLLRPVCLGAVALLLAWQAHAQVAYWENSLTLWRHAAAVTPPSPVQHTNLGNALLEAGRDSEAEAEFRAAISMGSNDPRPYVNLAVIAQHRRDIAGAITLLRQALVLAPADARIHSNLGSLLQDAGQMAEARSHLERAVVLRPDLAEAQINLGVLLAQSGELARARECFEAALHLRPGDPVAWSNLQLVLRQIDSGRARPPTEP